MLHNPPLLTIHRGHRRPEEALVEAFRGAQTSHICDAMDGRGALDYRIKPLDPENAVFVGPALTAFAACTDLRESCPPEDLDPHEEKEVETRCSNSLAAHVRFPHIQLNAAARRHDIGRQNAIYWDRLQEDVGQREWR